MIRKAVETDLPEIERLMRASMADLGAQEIERTEIELPHGARLPCIRMHRRS